jgi:hypothetical protein
MKSIVEPLEAMLRQGYSPHSVFSDWLDLMLYALLGDEERYLEIVRKYRNDRKQGEREIDYFCKAFAHLQLGMRKTNDDILGQVYMEWNMSNKYSGQFFTPKHIASMMAQCLNPKGKIIDPCCGSGVMLVEAIKTMDNEALDASSFYGQDVDSTCCKMCALNLLFFNVNGFVIWGDSLLLECKKVYQTSRSYLGGSIRELKDKELDMFREMYIPAVKKTIMETFSQAMTEEEVKKLSAQHEQLSFF